MEVNGHLHVLAYLPKGKKSLSGALWRRYFLPLLGIEPRVFGRPARNLPIVLKRRGVKTNRLNIWAKRRSRFEHIIAIYVFVSDERWIWRLDISVAFTAMSVYWHNYRMSSPEHGWCTLLMHALTSPLCDTSGLAIENGNDRLFWKSGNHGPTYPDQHPTKVKPSAASLAIFWEIRNPWPTEKSHESVIQSQSC